MPPYTTGTYAAPSNSFNPAVTNTAISSTDWAALLADLTTALSTCVLKDGTQTITANIPMSGFKLTGLAAGTASGNSLRYEQVNGLVTTAGDILQGTGAGTLARLAIGTAGQFPAVNAGATALAYQSMAAQSDQETGTSILAPVTPGRQQYHPSAAKAWVGFTTVGTTAILASYNVTSLTDNGTGDTTITYTVAFSSVNYAPAVSFGNAVSNVGSNMPYNTLATGSMGVRKYENGSPADSPCSVVIFGDQ
jgi:hypothetical protein